MTTWKHQVAESLRVVAAQMVSANDRASLSLLKEVGAEILRSNAYGIRAGLHLVNPLTDEDHGYVEILVAEDGVTVFSERNRPLRMPESHDGTFWDLESALSALSHQYGLGYDF